MREAYLPWRTFDNKLFSSHVISISKAALRSLVFIICNTKVISGPQCLLALYYALVRSKFEY